MNSTDTKSMIRRALFLSRTSEEEVTRSVSSFRDFAAQVLKLSVPGAAVILIGSSALRMTDAASDAVRTITLSRQFGRLDPEDSEQSLIAFVANLSSLVSSDPARGKLRIEDQLEDVVPLLKSAEYAEGNAAVLRRQHTKSGLDPDLHAKLSWMVNPKVAAFPVFNEPHGYRFITGDQLTDSGLTAFEIEDIAIQNVRDAANALAPTDYSKGSKEFSGLDGMASALVLLPEFLESEAEQAGGPLCILSGDADHLFIVPLANEEFLNFVLGKVANGALRLPEMPPLLYQYGRLEAAAIQAVRTAPSPLR